MAGVEQALDGVFVAGIVSLLQKGAEGLKGGVGAFAFDFFPGGDFVALDLDLGVALDALEEEHIAAAGEADCLS